MLFFFVHRLQRFPDWKRGSPDGNECHVYTAGRIENTHNVLDNVHLHTNDVHIGCVLAKIVATRGHEGIEVDTKAEATATQGTTATQRVMMALDHFGMLILRKPSI